MPTSTPDSLFAFVVMPFAPEYDSLFQIIKAAAKECGVYAERVDEQVFDTAIIDHIHNQINKSDFVIAVLTGLNPNVMYEVGYAIAARRTVVPIYPKGQGIPFDLNQRPIVTYNHESDVGPLLHTRLVGLVRLRSESSRPIIGSQREVYAGGVLLRPDIETEVEGHWSPDGWSNGGGGPATVHQARVGVRIAVHNLLRVPEPAVEYLCIQTKPKPGEYPVRLEGGTLTPVMLPGGDVLHSIRLDVEPVPDMWAEYLFTFGPSYTRGLGGEVERDGARALICHYTAFGPLRFPIHVLPRGFIKKDQQFAWAS